eukprot:656938-Rhodomonas_salina.1
MGEAVPRLPRALLLPDVLRPASVLLLRLLAALLLHQPLALHFLALAASACGAEQLQQTSSKR